MQGWIQDPAKSMVVNFKGVSIFIQITRENFGTKMCTEGLDKNLMTLDKNIEFCVLFFLLLNIKVLNVIIPI